jgi:hypothetical protein
VIVLPISPMKFSWSRPEKKTSRSLRNKTPS